MVVILTSSCIYYVDVEGNSNTLNLPAETNVNTEFKDRERVKKGPPQQDATIETGTSP